MATDKPKTKTKTKTKSQFSFLIVESETVIRVAIKKTLVDMGIEKITLCSNYDELKEFLSFNRVDFIICEWQHAHGRSELELLDITGADSRHPSTGVLLLTAERTREEIQKAIRAGVSELLVHPFPVNHLRQKINYMLENPGQAIINRTLNTQKKNISKRPLILIIDDIAENFEVFSGVLREEFQVKAALNGTKALHIAQSDPQPDLILLDIMMPVMDGYEVCRKLRENPLTEEIPVIFLTSKNEVTDIAKGFELGAVDYIAKPVIPSLLLARARTQIRLKQTRDNLKNEIDLLIENERLHQELHQRSQQNLFNPGKQILSISADLLQQTNLDLVSKNKLTTIHSHTEEMLSFIKQSQLLKQLENDQLQIKKELLNMVEYCSDIINSINSIQKTQTTASQPLSLQKVDKLEYESDPSIFTCMFENLLWNAIANTQKDEQVKVQLANEDNNNEIKIHLPVDFNEKQLKYFFSKNATDAGLETGKLGGAYIAYKLATLLNLNLKITNFAQRCQITIAL